MAVEKRIIKGSKKKYKRQKDGKEVTKCSLYITLGVNSGFNKGDEAVIIATDEYNELLDNTTNDNAINELNNIISDKDNMIKQLTNQIKELTASNNQLNNEIATLTNDLSDNKNEIATLKNELSKYDAYDIDSLLAKSKELDDFYKLSVVLHSEKIELKDAINYHIRCNDKLKSRNFLQRLFNKDVASDVDKPILKLISLNGHSLNNSDDNSNDIISKLLNNSE